MRLQNQSGFTLIEIIAVMVIMAVLSTVVIQKFALLTDRAAVQALKWGTSELSTREMLVWTKSKLSPSGWPGDGPIFSAVDKNLGPEYAWAGAGPTVDGGDLKFKATVHHVNRQHSTYSAAGRWFWL